MTSIVAIANQKGGVGKTTTAVNLATGLAAVGKKVLLIDLDPQGNAGTGFGIEEPKKTSGIYEVLLNPENLKQCVRLTHIPGLHLIPSSMDLAGFEIEVSKDLEREYFLKKALEKLEGYDFIFIDCPPALSLLTLNALCATDHVLIPLQCEFYALNGLSQLVHTVKRIQQNLNPYLNFFGIILTMYERRSSLSELVEKDVRAYFGDLVFQTVIPRSIRVSEAPSHGKPVLIYDVRSSGSLAYMKLAVEFLKRNGDAEWTKKQKALY